MHPSPVRPLVIIGLTPLRQSQVCRINSTIAQYIALASAAWTKHLGVWCDYGHADVTPRDGMSSGASWLYTTSSTQNCFALPVIGAATDRNSTRLLKSYGPGASTWAAACRTKGSRSSHIVRGAARTRHQRGGSNAAQSGYVHSS